MRSLLINVIVSVIWMLLQRELSVIGFGIGFVIGFAMIWLFKPVLGSGTYIRRTLGFVRFTGIFIRAFVTSCWSIGRAVLFAKIEPIQPMLISYNVRGLTRLEILLLSHCISLTPGTTTVEISPDFTRFVLHVFDTHDPDAVRRDIDQTLRRGILAFTR
jgi:multisubunit Na+/H+ antiporter MnhE subunit